MACVQRRSGAAPAGSGNVGTPIIAATIPIGRALGPLTIYEVGFRLLRGPADVPPAQMQQITLELNTSFSALIGPVYIRLDQLGIAFTLDQGKPPEQRKSPADRPASRPDIPAWNSGARRDRNCRRRRINLHDPDQGIYFGTLDLAFRGGLTMQAICLIATKLPDGTKGFSLVAIFTFELGNPFPIGMGFFLEGFGGMFAMNRTFDEVAMRAALPTGQLRNVLFPSDPVHHTAEILHALQTLFPGQAGSHLVGLLVKFGWASSDAGPLRARRALRMGQSAPADHPRPGQRDPAAPRPRHPQAQMDAVGILDFDAGTFALDAVLYDSRLCDHFVLTGAMAMRMGWKGSGRLRPLGRRTAPEVRRASGIPERGPAAARADQRRATRS